MALTDYMSQMPLTTARTAAATSANTRATSAADHKWQSGATESTGSGYDMSTEDFLTLIMAQFQNQDIMNPASTDDFINQMVQLMTIQTMTNMNDISTISYAASLVGKEVTVGVFGTEGLEEVVGTVTGTGLLNGQQVIFVNGQAYTLNSIMAIGRIPEEEDTDEVDPGFTVPGDMENGENGDGTVDGDGNGNVDGGSGTDGTDGAGNTDGTAGTEGSQGTQGGTDTGNTGGSGESTGTESDGSVTE
nr:flagellar hook capping FlgD N-terminal domain-containing protein [uncultured Butyricicoccus sp.]